VNAATRRMIAGTAAIVLVGGGGWLAGRNLQAPGEAALNARPPEAAPVTVAVERRKLTATIAGRGTAVAAGSRDVSLPGTGAGGATHLVTRVPEEGQVVDENGVLLELSGRPVFALQGALPMYRDLGPGSEGEDVLQLERALERLGFDPGIVDGRYDADTEASVRRWYSAAGHAPPEPDETDQRALRAAEDAVFSAEQQLSEATRPPSAADLLQAEAELRRAEASIPAADSEAGRTRRQGEAAVIARDEALAELVGALPGRESRQKRLVESKTLAARSAKTVLDSAESSIIPMDDAAAFQQRAEGILAARLAYEQALDDLKDAERALAELPAKHAKEVLDAQRAVAQARDAAASANEKASAAMVQAESDRAIAQARLDALRSPGSAASSAATVRSAEAALSRARAELERLRARTGTAVPANNVVFFPSLPVTVEKVGARVGEPPAARALTVSVARTVIRTSVSLADAKLVREGMPARLEARDLQLDLTGKVSRVAARPGTDGFDGQRVAVEITPDQSPPALKDASLRVTIPIASTTAEVLTVPLAAVLGGADGGSFVEVPDAAGGTRQVRIETGLSAEGYVEVVSSTPELREGDRVVVGGGGSG
jgi:multidrug efflux pump subunit AcrA (membrane-fusion protein)